jgi:hypothetical protein
MTGSLQIINIISGYRYSITKSRYLKVLFMIFFVILSVKATAPDFKVLYIIAPIKIDPYERLINAVVCVESSGDNMACNLIENAAGAFQIRPIRLLDYNQRTGNNYNMNDCYNFQISRKIFLFYAIRIGYPDYESIARKWNGSGKTTLDYWKKIKLYL